MLATTQRFVQRNFHALLMALVGAGFVLILLELIGYKHYQGLQIVGLATTVIGAIAAFAGIRATGRLRIGLAGVLIVLSLAGLLGAWEHNEKRLTGAGEERRPGAQSAEGAPNNQDAQPPAAPSDGTQPARPNGGQRPRGGFEIPPPPLAPLSLSGFCILGAVALLGRKDERPVGERANAPQPV